MSDDLVKRLTIMASVMEMGEKIAWGSDTSIMREASARIEELEAKLAKAVDGLRDAAEDMDGYVGKGYGDPYRELTEELTNTQKGQ